MSKPGPLSIAVAQPLCVAHDVSANVGAHVSLVRAAGARVVVFPELSLTGYEMDAAAVDPDDERLAPLIDACTEADAIAFAGAPTSEAGVDHISMLKISGHSTEVVYRKMYIGDDEVGRFSPGPAPAVVEIDGWRLGLAICKDTGVVDHVEQTAALGIEVYVAGVLEHQSDAGAVEERATRTAIDHGVWAVTASFSAPTGAGYQSPAGGSGIWQPDGSCLQRLRDETGTTARAVLH